jgi:hypothetical protein
VQAIGRHVDLDAVRHAAFGPRERRSDMSTATMTKAASAEDNRMAARRWIDAFNARDDDGEDRRPDRRLHRARP